MAAPLTAEEEKRYKSIIDGILATADLETISRRKILAGLEAELGGMDLSEQKAAIKNLIVQRFDVAQEAQQSETPVPPASATPAKRGADGTDEASASPEPAKKKTKRSASTEDADARLAAELQAQENSLARSRTTRGGRDGGRTKTAAGKKKKAAPRKKSANKVGADDDSEVDASGDSVAPKRKAGGGFQKPFNLSPMLSDLCGETQVVKKLWEHIKANDLQDPKDKRQIVCDERMHAVFRQTKVDMFKMNKEIGNHLYPVDEA